MQTKHRLFHRILLLVLIDIVKYYLVKERSHERRITLLGMHQSVFPVDLG